MPREIDTERVICALADIPEEGSRGFTLGTGDWPLRGFLVRLREREVRAYVNHCPHAGHPLNLQPNQFLTQDRSLILCNSHGALFEKGTGYCVAGPCAGRSLECIAVEVIDGYVLLKEVDGV
jgi:nitrite reductase/ring-hydroxylating ferredoxin subunit